MNLKKYTHAVKTYLADHKKDITTAVPIIIFAAVLIGIVVYATVKNMPKIMYQPTKACDLFTPAEAQDLLGDHVLNVNTNNGSPTISGDTATSKCSYTDSNPDADAMLVAAVAIRSGINDKGVAKNKADFAIAQSQGGNEVVKDLGDSAYFNNVAGQLNVLDDKTWIILSYGIGEKPEENTLDKAVELAHKVLR